jgi:Fe-S cluster assembly protein SufD
VLPLNQQTSERVAAGLPAGIRPRLEEAAGLFETMPMPDPREEDWRYVDLEVDLNDLGIPDGSGEPMPDDDVISTAIGEPAGRATIVDGRVVATEGDLLLSLAESDEGVWVAAGPAAIPAGLDKFAAARAAFGGDGVAVVVPRGMAVADPLLVEVQAVTPGALVLPRVVVAAAEGSEVSVVVHYRSPDGAPLVVAPAIEVLAGSNAHAVVTVLQRWGDETTAIAHQHLVAGRDAALTLCDAGLGGRFARLHATIDLDGQGADAQVLGLYFGDADQTHDYRAFMNHNAPNTTSEMFLKGAVGDEARSVFSGLIRIEPEAQKTNAHQTNRNLVLSEGAEAHSVPNLEILANDVRCGHGSAVGPLDAEQRYYLMSRGLDGPAADRLQVKGFFEEVLTRFPLLALEPPLRRAAMAKYAGIVERRAA